MRKSRGFLKKTIPFEEFYWAEYFRAAFAKQKFKVQSGKRGLKKAVELALKLTQDPAAKDLPGFKKTGRNSLEDCMNYYSKLEVDLTKP